ncbi:MAG TPA: F0F1 ATP synthase subunit alpha, partial [Gammaproteobacteria bacterium]|nr:F0F1 ATP synthase subunit alpha [Gammaproteobacteria bacterium]
MQQLNPAEISQIIKERIEGLNIEPSTKNEGTIIALSDGIVTIHGLDDIMYGEMIQFEHGLFGLALNLEKDSVGAVVLGDCVKLAEGQKCYTTGRILEVPVGPELLGRVVDALGNPIDGKGEIAAKVTSPVEQVAPGVITHEP